MYKTFRFLALALEIATASHFCYAKDGKAQNASSESCCGELSTALPGKVLFHNQSQYIESLDTYYSGQESDLRPTCIVRPLNTKDVSRTVKILSDAHKITRGICKFAIRSAGHTPYAGSANIAAGITIDLRSLNEVNFNEAKNVTSIGPGARWKDVYSTLDPQNVTVVGGRSARVGVGGLMTGGGISFFSPQFGWACDNILAYEIVLADGSVVTVTNTSYSDLYTVLRGGSNNFGIVTRFDLFTFSPGLLWGGNIIYNFTTLPKQLKAFIDFSTDNNYDEHAAFIQIFAAAGGQYFVIDNPVYTKPQPYPPAFERFTSIEGQISNQVRIGSHGKLTESSADTEGLRQAFLTTTWKADLSFLQSYLTPVWLSFSNMTSRVAGLSNTLLNQPLPRPFLVQSALRGPNMFNLPPLSNNSTPPPIITLLSLTWNSSADDTFMHSAAESFIESVESGAKAKGLYLDFKYLNYADKNQDVIRGYGDANREKMRKVSRKYDPDGVFQKGAPGGFKVFS